MDYRSSGVDIDAGNETVRRIKGLARATFTPGVLSEIGKDDLAVGTGSGLLRVLSIQPEGKKPMTAPEFLRGHKIAGKKFSAK